MFALILVFLCTVSLVPASDAPRTLIIGDEVISMTLYGRQPGAEQPEIQVALVLSGGGARGFAHLPIIEAIERHGIPIDMVLGTSMGSLVGGLYAAGYSPGDMRRLIGSHNMVELFTLPALPPMQVEVQPLRKDRDNLFTLGFDRGGLGTASGVIGDQRILHMLNDALSRVAGITDFDQLAIPFRCIGADLATGERIIFSEGSLVTAIRSSISIPLVFTPYPVGDRMVIDGGIVDNMPVALAREMGADIVIAVDVNAVDYAVSTDELESLTAILAQLIVIITKNTVTEQQELADILITPALEDHGILDFLGVDHILDIGVASASAHEDDFVRIAEQIGRKRDLEPKDPDRYGLYFLLPDVNVVSVSHRALGSYQEKTSQLDLDLFDDFIGFPLDSLKKQQLNQIFERLRSSGAYATVTYDYTDVEQRRAGSTWGNLEIQTRQFPPKRSSLSAGAFGATSLAITPGQPTQLYFTPDFSITYSLREVFDPFTTFSLRVANDDALTIEAQLRHDVMAHVEAGFLLGYMTGGIHPLNLRHAARVLDVRDRMVMTQLFLQYRPSDFSLVKLSSELDYLRYGAVDNAIGAFIPSVSLEGVYTTMPYRFFPSHGFRFDYGATAEFGEPFGYRIEARMQHAIPLGSRDVLLWDLHAGSAHVTHPRRQSYVDYGGSRAIPSYPAYTLVDDMLIARIKHHHYISSGTPNLLLQSMFTVSSRGETVYTLLESDSLFDPNPGLPFSSLGSVEFSGSLAFGLAFEQIDLLFGFAMDNNLRIAIFLEVL